MNLRAAAAANALLIAISASGTVSAQKRGGFLTMYIWDNPPSMSMLDGVNPIGQRVTMGVFNNLVMFDQHVKQSSLKSIVPDLATGWSWNEEGTALTLPLRKGVKWHDGKPFTAKDVQYTWDLQLDKSSDKLRINTRKFWYRNLEEVTVNGDYEVTFHLKRPQPAFPMLLASGFAPILQSASWRRTASTTICSSTGTSRPSTTPICGERWRSPSTARRSSISSAKDRAISAAFCSLRPKGCGACRSSC